jgi:hypothetical protein
MSRVSAFRRPRRCEGGLLRQRHDEVMEEHRNVLESVSEAGEGEEGGRISAVPRLPFRPPATPSLPCLVAWNDDDLGRGSLGRNNHWLGCRGGRCHHLLRRRTSDCSCNTTSNHQSAHLASPGSVETESWPRSRPDASRWLRNRSKPGARAGKSGLFLVLPRFKRVKLTQVPAPSFNSSTGA